MKFKGLLALSFIPLMLTGCSQSLTPMFNDSSDGVNVSQGQSSSGDQEKGSSGESDKGHENDAKTSSETSKNSNDDSTDTSTGEVSDGKSSDAKKDDNANKNDTNFTGDKLDDAVISKEPDSDNSDSSKKNTNIYDPSEADFGTAVKEGNDFSKNIKAKKWKQACDNVYKIEGVNCATHLEELYKDGNTFINYTQDNVTGVMLSKKSMVISLKDKHYEDSQRMTFVQQDGNWKIFIK